MEPLTVREHGYHLGRDLQCDPFTSKVKHGEPDSHNLVNNGRFTADDRHPMEQLRTGIISMCAVSFPSPQPWTHGRPCVMRRRFG
jgi:hypothetical protein